MKKSEKLITISTAIGEVILPTIIDHVCEFSIEYSILESNNSIFLIDEEPNAILLPKVTSLFCIVDLPASKLKAMTTPRKMVAYVTSINKSLSLSIFSLLGKQFYNRKKVDPDGFTALMQVKPIRTAAQFSYKWLDRILAKWPYSASTLCAFLPKPLFEKLWKEAPGSQTRETGGREVRVQNAECLLSQHCPDSSMLIFDKENGPTLRIIRRKGCENSMWFVPTEWQRPTKNVWILPILFSGDLTFTPRATRYYVGLRA